MTEEKAQLWFDDLMEKLPGYPEKFDGVCDPKQLDDATLEFLSVLTSMCGNSMIVKGAYILGAYNEERGLHATKH